MVPGRLAQKCPSLCPNHSVWGLVNFHVAWQQLSSPEPIHSYNVCEVHTHHSSKPFLPGPWHLKNIFLGISEVSDVRQPRGESLKPALFCVPQPRGATVNALRGREWHNKDSETKASSCNRSLFLTAKDIIVSYNWDVPGRFYCRPVLGVPITWSGLSLGLSFPLHWFHSWTGFFHTAEKMACCHKR